SLRQIILRMTRRLAAPLAELFQLLHGHVIAGQMQQAVKQHRTVTRRKNKPIAVGPARLAGIVSEKTRPKHVGHGRRSHREPGMAGISLLDGVDRQESDGVDAEFIERAWIQDLLVLESGTTLQRISPP